MPNHFYGILIFTSYYLFFGVVNELCQRLNFNSVLFGCSYCPHLYFMCIKLELKLHSTDVLYNVILHIEVIGNPLKTVKWWAKNIGYFCRFENHEESWTISLTKLIKIFCYVWNTGIFIASPIEKCLHLKSELQGHFYQEVSACAKHPCYV